MRYIVKVTVPLEIDTTDMVLDGEQWYLAPTSSPPLLEKTAFIHPGAHKTREAEGGSPPYQYTSSDPDIAAVDAKTGQVISTGNGTARISAQDMRGVVVCYDVICTNVYELVFNPKSLNFSGASAWMSINGAQWFSRLPRLNEVDPTIDAVCFSFQSLGANIGWLYFTAIVDGKAHRAAGFRNVHVQWEHLPYSPWIVLTGSVDASSAFSSVGYRLKPNR
jgi:hypothetical protein